MSVPPSLPRSRKRLLRDTEEYWNGPVQKSATGWAEFVVDLELAEEVEISVSPHKKRPRGLNKSKQSAMIEAAGKCAQIRKAVDATEKAVGCDDAQVAEHRESHKGIAATAAATHPMDSDSEQTNRNDRSANKRSQKVSTSKPPSKATGRRGRFSAWEDHLSELADYRKTHGHCKVPRGYTNLGKWVSKQRCNYKLLLLGKPVAMTTFRIKELDSLGFEWDCHSAAWEDRLSELADYRKTHGHCNVPQGNTKLGNWVSKQRSKYKLPLQGKPVAMTTFQIKELDSLGFEWNIRGAA